jgi:hypothetical protein
MVLDRDNELLVIGSAYGIDVYDASTFTSPSAVGDITLSYSNTGFMAADIANSRIFLKRGSTSLFVIDYSTPSSPSSTEYTFVFGAPSDGAKGFFYDPVNEWIITVSDFSALLEVYDVSDLNSISLLGSYTETIVSTYYFAKYSSGAYDPATSTFYATTNNNVGSYSFVSLDLSDPTDITRLDTTGSSIGRLATSVVLG